MADYEIVMPKMGESVQEATITRWFKKEGDKIREDDVLLEIATDKVDTEIPSPVAGILSKRLYKENDVVPVGEVIAVVDAEGKSIKKEETAIKEDKKAEDKAEAVKPDKGEDTGKIPKSGRFYKPAS